MWRARAPLRRADASSPLATATELEQGALAGLICALHPTKPQRTPPLTLQLNTLLTSTPRLTDTGPATETDGSMPTLAAYRCIASKGASRSS